MQLFVHVVALEEREGLVGFEELDPVLELGDQAGDVLVDLLVEGRVVDDDAAVLAVELLADDPHGKVGLLVEQRRRP